MEIKLLSETFYKTHRHIPELMQKGKFRPYIILIIEIENIKFALPFRTHLYNRHDDVFRTSTLTDSGIDFTKAVPIMKNSYIGKDCLINDIEFKFIKYKENEIKVKFKSFLKDFKKDYIRHKNSPSLPKNKRFNYCTLNYFAKELHLE